MHLPKVKILITSFLRYHNDIENLPGFFGHAWPNPTKKVCINLQKTLIVISMQNIATINNYFWLQKTSGKKIKFISHLFLKVLLSITNLAFLVLWVCIATPIKNISINLMETLMFIYMQKINLIPLLFFAILYFKESGYLNEHLIHNLRTRNSADRGNFRLLWVNFPLNSD